MSALTDDAILLWQAAEQLQFLIHCSFFFEPIKNEVWVSCSLPNLTLPSTEVLLFVLPLHLQVLVNDFFLVACLEDFIENARLFIFETFCRIHQCISIG